MQEMKSKQVKNESDDDEKKDSMKNQSVMNVSEIAQLHWVRKWWSIEYEREKNWATYQDVFCALILSKLFM